MLFLVCNSFFTAAKSSGELQTTRSFLIVIVRADPKVTVFCCFYLEKNGDLICYEVSGTI